MRMASPSTSPRRSRWSTTAPWTGPASRRPWSSSDSAVAPRRKHGGVRDRDKRVGSAEPPADRVHRLHRGRGPGIPSASLLHRPGWGTIPMSVQSIAPDLVAGAIDHLQPDDGLVTRLHDSHVPTYQTTVASQPTRE